MQIEFHRKQNAQVDTWSLAKEEFQPHTFAYNNIIKAGVVDAVRITFEDNDDRTYEVDIPKEDMEKQLKINWRLNNFMGLYSIKYSGEPEWAADIKCAGSDQIECFKYFFRKTHGMTIEDPPKKRSPPKKPVHVAAPVPVQQVPKVPQLQTKQKRKVDPFRNIKKVIGRCMIQNGDTQRYHIQKSIYTVKYTVGGSEKYENGFMFVALNQDGDLRENYEEFVCSIRLLDRKGSTVGTLAIGKINIESFIVDESGITGEAKLKDGTFSVLTVHLHFDDDSAKEAYAEQLKLFNKKKGMMLEYSSRCGRRRRLLSQ